MLCRVDSDGHPAHWVAFLAWWRNWLGFARPLDRRATDLNDFRQNAQRNFLRRTSADVQSSRVRNTVERLRQCSASDERLSNLRKALPTRHNAQVRRLDSDRRQS